MLRLRHSDNHIPFLSTERLTRYFTEVVLKSEYRGSHDELLHKWNKPITYHYDPEISKTTASLIDTFFRKLNRELPLKGVSRTEEPLKANVRIYFLKPEEIYRRVGKQVNYENADGITLYTFSNRTGEIISGKVYYNIDMKRSIRKSVIREELVNLMGLGNDTVLRKDSILYQYSSDNEEPSPIDWLIMKLLYDERMKCGMNHSQCEEIIRELYY
ncbi:MAG: DUF2927 domain-containing protein [Erysipelotrichaceae bacterium]|nr:DUF2927 domain-containing protein [Erysipelotrichaceae bacterium]